MACIRTAISLALLITAAIAAELPPHSINVEDHIGFHGGNNPNFPFDMNADLVEESFILANIVAVEERTPEMNDLDEPTLLKNQEENDEQTYDESLEENDKNEESKVKYALQRSNNNKVACDFIASPRVSCYSCYTYIDCKSNGEGKIKQCSRPYAPYCNEGLCSATPTAECDPNPEPEDLEEASGDPNLN